MSAENMHNLFSMGRLQDLTKNLLLSEESKGRSSKGATFKKNISEIFQ
jgi:hypothetical protein